MMFGTCIYIILICVCLCSYLKFWLWKLQRYENWEINSWITKSKDGLVCSFFLSNMFYSIVLNGAFITLIFRKNQKHFTERKCVEMTDSGHCWILHISNIINVYHKRITQMLLQLIQCIPLLLVNAHLDAIRFISQCIPLLSMLV